MVDLKFQIFVFFLEGEDAPFGLLNVLLADPLLLGLQFGETER